MADAKSRLTEANGFSKKKSSETVANLPQIIKLTSASCDNVMRNGIAKFSEEINADAKEGSRKTERL